MNRHSIGNFSFYAQDTWLMEGYVYKLDLGGGKHQWIPDYVQETGYVQLGYSLLTYTPTGLANDYDCDTITKPKDPPTSFQEMSIRKNGTLSVYPNPSSGGFTVNWSSVRGDLIMRIYDVLGRQVLEQANLGAHGSSRVFIELPGIYVVTMQNKEEVLSNKVVVH